MLVHRASAPLRKVGAAASSRISRLASYTSISSGGPFAGGQHLVHIADVEYGADPLRSPLCQPARVGSALGQHLANAPPGDRTKPERRLSGVFANLGWDKVQLPHPVFEGDTVYSPSDVIEARPSRSRTNVGIVNVRTTGFNQNGTEVMTFRRTVMVYKRGMAPRTAHPTKA